MEYSLSIRKSVKVYIVFSKTIHYFHFQKLFYLSKTIFPIEGY